ncbi:MAG: hypothetical protein MOP51_961, partial [Citricoccus sp.]|nr:hypothetical protein [Citricoccus sp. WCRC_4]
GLIVLEVAVVEVAGPGAVDRSEPDCGAHAATVTSSAVPRARPASGRIMVVGLVIVGPLGAAAGSGGIMAGQEGIVDEIPPERPESVEAS